MCEVLRFHLVLYEPIMEIRYRVIQIGFDNIRIQVDGKKGKTDFSTHRISGKIVN